MPLTTPDWCKRAYINSYGRKATDDLRVQFSLFTLKFNKTFIDIDVLYEYSAVILLFENINSKHAYTD